jgi:hypothetical protein
LVSIWVLVVMGLVDCGSSTRSAGQSGLHRALVVPSVPQTTGTAAPWLGKHDRSSTVVPHVAHRERHGIETFIPRPLWTMWTTLNLV